MIITEEKIIVHFFTNGICVYRLKNGTSEPLKHEYVIFEEKTVTDSLLRKINGFLGSLEGFAGAINNEHIRLYATGIFQQFEQSDQERLITHVYVDYGLYFNIIPPDLEQFYKEKSETLFGSQNIVYGLIHQEFRRVVICGSFQQHLEPIGHVMEILQKRNISVLSPWTTEIVPETLGTDFILLVGQEPLKNKRDAWKHKLIHMNKFRQSDAIIVCNPGGYIGRGTMFEFGFMVAISKRIIFTEKPMNLSIPFPYEIGLNFE